MGRPEFFFWFDFRIYRLDSQFYIKFGVADPLCDSFYQFYRGFKKTKYVHTKLACTGGTLQFLHK